MACRRPSSSRSPSFAAGQGDFNAVATVFDDFEGKTYEGWTITGDAFGKGPSHGTEPGQQPVSGFSGHGLVNTFVGGDGPQGTATSKPFRIQRRYIGFLIGGGNNPGKTCINLRVGGKVVRTATGKDREALEPASWDVADLKGKEAVLEIVDRSSEGWGHINIDRIIFSDVPPEPLLSRGTAIESVVKALPLGFTAAEEATLPAGGRHHDRRHSGGRWPRARAGQAQRSDQDGTLPVIRVCAVSARASMAIGSWRRRRTAIRW